MTQAAKAQEPTMEEILASIRRIIADDDAAKPAAKPEPPEPPKPVPAAAAPPKAAQPASPPKRAPASPPAPAPVAKNSQDDIDAMLAELGGGPPKEEPAPAPAVEQDDILDLTESMAALEETPDVVFEQPPPAASEPVAPSMVDIARRQFERELGVPSSLLSANTSDVVNSAFNSLANTVLVQNARTLEDLVREMLRPMLKAWLDDNLPGLVERLVRAEIERVSRGRS
jgi:cell pole-organizing protein PopZ